MDGMGIAALGSGLWAFPPSRDSDGGTAWLLHSQSGASVLVDVPLLPSIRVGLPSETMDLRRVKLRFIPMSKHFAIYLLLSRQLLSQGSTTDQ